MRGRLLRVLRWAVAPAADRRTWTGTAVLVAGVVPAAVVMTVVLLLLVVGAALAPVGVGVPLLVAALALVTAAARLDQRLLGAGLDLGDAADPDDPRRAGVGVGPAAWVRAARRLAADGRTWRCLAWLAVRTGAGATTLVGLLVTAVLAAALLSVPFVDGYLASGTWRSSAGIASAWTLPVALVLLVGVTHGLRVVVQGHVRIAGQLLGPDPVERLETLRRTVEAAADRERLARDLHDGLGHALTLVVVQAEAALAAGGRDPAATTRHLQAVTTAARRALDDLDRTLGLLHDGVLAEPDLGALDGLASAARDAGLDLTLDVDGRPSAGPEPFAGLPAVWSAAAYRVVQESLTNALRHGSGRRARVDVATGDGLRVVVSSDGPRAAPRSGGRGLAGLQARVASAGGRLEAGEHAGGWVVTAVWRRP